MLTPTTPLQGQGASGCAADELIRELGHVKAVFQLRAIVAAMGLHPDHDSVRPYQTGAA